MRTTQPPTLNRLPRLIVWAKSFVLWAAAVLLCGGDGNSRRRRQRRTALSIPKFTHFVRNLLIIRAAQFLRPRRSRIWRNVARRGFQHRPTRMRLRSIGGSRLRRFMKEGSFAQRVARLVHIVRNLDTYVKAYLARRAENGINRLSPLIAIQPPHAALRSRAQQTPALADSS